MTMITTIIMVTATATRTDRTCAFECDPLTPPPKRCEESEGRASEFHIGIREGSWQRRSRARSRIANGSPTSSPTSSSSIGFPFITLNPGASYRGLHDSLVNHNGDEPPMLLCQHEKIAVQIAHGYAKASGKPLAVIVHNVVGLLHATMGIYYAYTDRAPVFVIGATGPMDEGKRRPRVDWAAHRECAGHAGPRLREMGLSAGRHRGRARQLRARLFDHDDRAARPDLHVLRRRASGSAAHRARSRCPIRKSPKTPSRIAPDPDRACEEAADRLVAAEWPVLLPQFVGRDARTALRDMVALAETTRRARRSTCMSRLNFPTEHPLDMRMNKEVFKQADLIALLDCRDWERPTHYNDRINRTLKPLYPGSIASGSISALPTSRSRNGRRTIRNSPNVRSACLPTPRSPCPH